MLDLLQKNPEATQADLAELEAATQPRRPPVIRASTLSERIRDKYYDLFESATRQPIGRIADALGLSDLQGIANERATGGKLLMAGAVPPPGAGTLATVAKEAQAARALTGGFYSRVDEAAKLLPAKGVKAESLINTLKKASGGVSAEELELRGLAEFAASKRGQVVTPADLSAHLKANPAPFPTVKTLQNHPSGWTADDSVALDELESLGHRRTDAQDEAYQRLIDRENTASNPGVPPTLPEFSQYQVPGGENYRETLLTLPKGGTGLSEAENQRFNYLQHRRTSGAYDMMRGPLKDELQALKDKRNPPAKFRSPHFNDPNIVAHTRSNERTSPTGERGTFLEEVQSDWHQKGKEKGYRIPGDRDRANDLLRQMDDIEREVGFAEAAADPRYRALGAELNTASTQNPNGVPDAPFKENWSDLSLKQALIDEANRSPDPGFLGFTGGKTQAARYDLSKQVGKVEADLYDIAGDNNWRLKAWDINGNQLPISNQYLTDTELADHIGKDMARKIIADKGGVYTGLDLQVGGEGMHEFYDKLLPKRLEKIVKPFGGSVERGEILGAPLELQHTGRGRIVKYPQPEPAWLSRLTPEIKARILKEGLPLMGLSGLTLGNLLGQEQEPVR